MIKKLVALMTLLWCCFPLAGQIKRDSLKAKISTADKVELLSHQDLYVQATKADYSRGINDYRHKIVSENHQVNDSIVTERKLLTKAATDTLLQLLSDNHPEKMPMDRASCFEPHQAIVLYNKGLCSYIDICFGCRTYSSSKDILFAETFLSTNQAWTALKAFFINHGLTYKIEGKEKGQ